MIQVVVLNGPSSAGKSSLARVLQNLLPDPWLALGVDTLISVMPPRLDGAPEGLVIQPDGEVLVGPSFQALEDDWRRAVGAMARSGMRLLLDEVIFGGADGQRAWNEALAGVSVLWVGIHCDLAELSRREAVRGDRVAGMAAKQASFVHAGLVYDLEIDTSGRSPEDAARIVAERMLKGPRSESGPG
jgi:chloramphenicol 3-O phosphotransferase